jgi:hypothetical protein
MKITLHSTMLGLGLILATFTIATPYRNGAWLDPATTMSVIGLSLNYGLGPVMIAPACCRHPSRSWRVETSKRSPRDLTIQSWPLSAQSGSFGFLRRLCVAD